MSGIEFGELPPSLRNKNPVSYAQVAQQLKSRPGEWAKILTASSSHGASNVQTGIQNAGLAAFRPLGAFESTKRGLEVWARYVGDEATS